MSQDRLVLGPRRGYFLEAEQVAAAAAAPGDGEFIAALEKLNSLFRALVSIMYNCVPLSGHPGGSISSSRIVESLLYRTMDYHLNDPHAPDADIISYAAGHKALGLYALWALRNEVARIAAGELLPEEKHQLRLEDLLGFRRNPTQGTPLFRRFRVKPLDGHPTPATPHVKLSTGASGVGVPASFGLALAARDLYPQDPPLVHVIEGEGGLTPGRVQEAMAAAATAGLDNIVLHIDWNQASIDSNRVCRDGDRPGDYVQWNPLELARLHDFNVIEVAEGFDYAQVLAAQRRALEKRNGQPTAIVYRTVKGWRYGIEGRASHGAGHPLCSEEFYQSLRDFEMDFSCEVPKFCVEMTDENLESYYWDLLQVIRRQLESHRELVERLARGLRDASARLQQRRRRPREDAPRLELVYDTQQVDAERPPPEVVTGPGEKTTLRGTLGQALDHLNRLSGGAFMAAAADLLGSTSINKVAAGFPGGFYHAGDNPGARLVSLGGICEDAMGAMLAGLSTPGRHIGVGSSYGAFIAALQHVAVRLHAIGQQARRHAFGIPYSTYIMVCAHAGLKTGEDGPTHADPQCLQLLQENFAPGTMITLTPWDPNEIWPCLVTALQKRPAILAPFVTRPAETVFDREKLGLAPPQEARTGLYALRRASGKKPSHGTVILQGSGVTNTFVGEVLPRLDEAGYNLNIFYVSSAELFDMLPAEQRRAIFPEELARQAMAITGFTLPTMYRWVTSEAGRRCSLHAFKHGHYLGSGKAHKVLEEAGLDGEGQFAAVKAYADSQASGQGGCQ